MVRRITEVKRIELKNILQADRNAFWERYDRKYEAKMRVVNDHVVEISRLIKYMRYEEYFLSKSGPINKLFSLYYNRRKNCLGNKLGIVLPANCFKEGLTIFHGDIIVNAGVKAGKNCRLHGQNCLGNDGTSMEAPTLGDNVDIGVGAKVIGGIYIADNVKIGAGAVVVKSSTKKGATLVGVPAHEI